MNKDRCVDLYFVPPCIWIESGSRKMPNGVEVAIENTMLVQPPGDEWIVPLEFQFTLITKLKELWASCLTWRRLKKMLEGNRSVPCKKAGRRFYVHEPSFRRW